MRKADEKEEREIAIRDKKSHLHIPQRVVCSGALSRQSLQFLRILLPSIARDLETHVGLLHEQETGRQGSKDMARVPLRANIRVRLGCVIPNFETRVMRHKVKKKLLYKPFLGGRGSGGVSHGWLHYN